MTYKQKVEAVQKELAWIKSLPSSPVSQQEWAERILKSIGISGRELDEKEKAKGRSTDYWDMDSREQWAEDKRLGILDWDGN
jgi:hypothetical protein